MNKKVYSTAFLSLLGITSYAQQDTSTKRPNIILFLVDDMGLVDTSLPFLEDTTHWNKHFCTPNLEKLAAQGVKFTQAYASSVSSPTRVSLLTGVNPTRHGVTNWTLNKNQATDGDNPLLSFNGWMLNGLSPVEGIDSTYYCTPFPKLLQDNDYHTIFVGKAHFGARGTAAENPLNVGFDVNIGGHAAGGPGSYLGVENFGNYKTVQPIEGISFTNAIKGKKINKNRPLYWHYPNDWGERGNECGAPSCAIIQGDMKLIHFFEDSRNELYDISQDIGEKDNLIGKGSKYDALARRLAKKLSRRLRDEGSSMPVIKSTGQKVPYPDQTI